MDRRAQRGEGGRGPLVQFPVDVQVAAASHRLQALKLRAKVTHRAIEVVMAWRT